MQYHIKCIYVFFFLLYASFFDFLHFNCFIFIYTSFICFSFSYYISCHIYYFHLFSSNVSGSPPKGRAYVVIRCSMIFFLYMVHEDFNFFVQHDMFVLLSLFVLDLEINLKTLNLKIK